METVTTNGKNRFNHALQSVNNVGIAGADTLSIKEYGDGAHHITEITLNKFIVGALAGAAAALAMGNLLYRHPAGKHLKIVSAFSAISLKAAGTAVNVDLGLGSSGSAAAAALLSTVGAVCEDIVTGQTVATAAAGGTAVSGMFNVTAGVQTGIALNGSSSGKNVYLNAAGTWNANNTGNLTATGKIVLVWDTLI